MDTELLVTDGGRRAAGYVGVAGDCAVRAIAVATGRPYRLVYDELHSRQREFVARRGSPRRRSSPRDGVGHDVWRPYLLDLGWHWTATPAKWPRLCAGDLPAGRLVVEVHRHLVAVIDGVGLDAWDSRGMGVEAVWTGPTHDQPLDRPVTVDRPQALQLFAC